MLSQYRKLFVNGGAEEDGREGDAVVELDASTLEGGRFSEGGEGVEEEEELEGGWEEEGEGG